MHYITMHYMARCLCVCVSVCVKGGLVLVPFFMILITPASNQIKMEALPSWYVESFQYLSISFFVVDQ